MDGRRDAQADLSAHTEFHGHDRDAQSAVVGHAIEALDRIKDW